VTPKPPRHFFAPLATGAPAPLRDLPVRLERMIHFVPPHLEKVRAKAPEIAGQVDVLLANLEDAIPADAMDQLLALLEAKHGLKKPILLHALLETAQGVANVEAIAGASPRMQGVSLGPADLAASRKMKTTRVGGGHPGYRVLADANSDGGARESAQQDLWHYTFAKMVDACAMHGIKPFYGPFGDISDGEACEQQFRNAFLMGCAGAWAAKEPEMAKAYGL